MPLDIRDEVSFVTRPIKELRGIPPHLFDPGRTQIVKFKLGLDELPFPNPDMKRTVEPRTFKT